MGVFIFEKQLEMFAEKVTWMELTGHVAQMNIVGNI